MMKNGFARAPNGGVYTKAQTGVERSHMKAQQVASNESNNRLDG